MRLPVVPDAGEHLPASGGATVFFLGGSAGVLFGPSFLAGPALGGGGGGGEGTGPGACLPAFLVAGGGPCLFSGGAAGGPSSLFSSLGFRTASGPFLVVWSSLAEMGGGAAFCPGSDWLFPA